jgi:hypothetical protein
VGLCSLRASPAVVPEKAKKKESKILQNEATKSNRINKTTRKIGQNEAKRSEKSQTANRHKPFGISKSALAVVLLEQFKANFLPQGRLDDGHFTR